MDKDEQIKELARKIAEALSRDSLPYAARTVLEIADEVAKREYTPLEDKMTLFKAAAQAQFGKMEF
jgi:hypothetical protein